MLFVVRFMTMQSTMALKEFKRDFNFNLAVSDDLVVVLFIPKIDISDEQGLTPRISRKRFETKLAWELQSSSTRQGLGDPETVYAWTTALKEWPGHTSASLIDEWPELWVNLQGQRYRADPYSEIVTLTLALAKNHVTTCCASSCTVYNCQMGIR